MKLQRLTESMKDEQSTLRSELAKREKLVEKLRKETEVNFCSYIISLCKSLHN